MLDEPRWYSWQFMLALNLARIRAAEERFEQEYQPGALSGTDDYRVKAPVRLVFTIYKDKQHFRLVGTVAATLELVCSRCLDPFEWPVQTEFDLRYQPHAENEGDGEREIEEDDMTTSFYENDEIDLAQLLQEQFYLSLPMKPLCREDCAGLCPVCGINRNRGTCSCQTEWEDPRLTALRALKKDS
jgi:uncharacterized protein